MKKAFNDFYKNFKIEWKLYLVKFGFLSAGLYLFTLGIAIYAPTAVGASHMDFAIYSLIMNFWGTTSSGTLDSSVQQAHYPTVLTIYFIGIMLVSVIFAIASAIIKQKKHKDKTGWIKVVVVIVTDLIITFLLPQIIAWQWLYVDMSKLDSDALDANARNLVFLGAWVIYVFGVAAWVYSGWLLGPYNSVADSFINLTKMKYNLARILMDILIIAPGFIIVFAAQEDWTVKSKFLLNYLNFGTVFFVIITGPVAGLIINNICKKICDYDKLKIKLNQTKEIV